MKENPSSIEVFDFDKNWHLVVPHLHDDKVERVLAESLQRYDQMYPNSIDFWHRREGLRRRDRKLFSGPIGPWRYSPNYWTLKASRRVARAGCGPHLNRNQRSEKRAKALRQAEVAFYPRPDTVEWYQAFGLCHWLAPWLRELGERIYPQYLCCILSGECHSLAYSVDHGNKIRVIFDILNFREMTAKQLIEFATRKREEREKALSC